MKTGILGPLDKELKNLLRFYQKNNILFYNSAEESTSSSKELFTLDTNEALFEKSDIIIYTLESFQQDNLIEEIIKHGCHLLLYKPFPGDTEKIKHFFKLANESETLIELNNSLLFTRTNQETLKHISKPLLIQTENNFSQHPGEKQLFQALYQNMSFVQQFIQDDFKKIQIIQPENQLDKTLFLQVRLDFRQKTYALITLNCLRGENSLKTSIIADDINLDLDFVKNKIRFYLHNPVDTNVSETKTLKNNVIEEMISQFMSTCENKNNYLNFNNNTYRSWINTMEIWNQFK